MMNTAVALDFKSANLYALRLVLRESDPARLHDALAQRMREAGSLFENEPVIIDALHLADDAQLDWAALLAALREYKLPPIGVVADGALRDAAVQAGLPPVELSAAATRPAQTSNAATDEAPAAPPTMPVTKIVSRPLRSGQRVYADGGTLVVIGLVSQGAEIIADGDIHVYGPLRGKAIAGARGNTSARIFTTHLDPELLAIAGIYRVVENQLPATLHTRPAQVWLQDDSLEMAAM